MKKVEIFTDGACSGNPGAGGWGTILRYNGVEKELSGGKANTTNNCMELTAVVKGLKALKEPCEVILTSDSQYVCNAIEKGWAKKWKEKNWIIKGSEKRPNYELWEQLLPLLEKHTVTVKWVRGHNGHPENERCDKLAVKETKKFL